MIKGKSTIQLFDAKTNKEVERVVNDNMLTNAISNILNVPLDYTYNIGFKNVADLILPLATNGLGGIEIWDNTIEENPNIIYPPANVHEVGHAGGEYSGSSKYRGSYNANESGKTENGYRHVWDFSTDKANGEIKCLSLTSRAGGNVGLHGDDSNSCTMYGIAKLRDTGSVYEAALGRVRKNVYAFISTQNEGNYAVLKYVNMFNSSNITLNQYTDKKGYTFETKKIALSKSPYSCKLQRIKDNPIIYLLYYSGNSIWYAIINIDTGTLVSENSITLSIPSNYRNSVYYFNGVADDGIYVTLYNNGYYYQICKFALDGSYIGTATDYSWSSYYTYNVHKIGDRWYVGYYGLTDKTDTLSTSGQSGDYISCYDYDNQHLSPLYTSEGYNTSYGELNFNLYQNYLATINNLAVPVTKTSALTMKITYDLIQT